MQIFHSPRDFSRQSDQFPKLIIEACWRIERGRLLAKLGGVEADLLGELTHQEFGVWLADREISVESAERFEGISQ